MVKEKSDSTICSPSSAALKHRLWVLWSCVSFGVSVAGHLALADIVIFSNNNNDFFCANILKQYDCGQVCVIDLGLESQANQFSFCDK